MRPGLFVTLVASLFALVLLVMPVPRRIAVLPGGVGPSPQSPPVCLALSYGDTVETRASPQAMKLTADTLRWNKGWFRAVGGPGDRLYTDAAWRPAGPDSMDVAWHHSRILRLPTHGARRVGRAASTFPGTILGQLSAPDYAVIAEPVRCIE